MKFNTDKCHTIRFTLKSNSINATYHMGGRPFTLVTEYPYLGLILTSKLSWQTHINIISAKANRMLGLIRRNLRGSTSLYVSLVRPHLGYCCTIWNPYIRHSRPYISKVENIQRQAARFVVNN